MRDRSETNLAKLPEDKFVGVGLGHCSVSDSSWRKKEIASKSFPKRPRRLLCPSGLTTSCPDRSLIIKEGGSGGGGGGGGQQEKVKVL